jgi:hypothetical protein
MSKSKNQPPSYLSDLSSQDLYQEIVARKKSIPNMKSQAAMLETQMKHMCNDLMYSNGVSFTEQEIRSIRERLDTLKKEMKILDGFTLQPKHSYRPRGSKLSYKECFSAFMEENDGTFSPSCLLDYVSCKRGVESSNSVRVYVHRMLKEMTAEGLLVHLGHGKYCKLKKDDSND